MRTALLIIAIALIGCGAEAPSGPSQDTDASSSSDASNIVDASADASCPSGLVRVGGSRCAPDRDDNCDGVACRGETHCVLDTNEASQTVLICE
jgi:hypothetical protein